MRLERYDEALPLFEDALDVQGQVLGEHHPDRLVTMFNLAVLHDTVGRLDEAAALNEEVLINSAIGDAG